MAPKSRKKKQKPTTLKPSKPITKRSGSSSPTGTGSSSPTGTGSSSATGAVRFSPGERGTAETGSSSPTGAKREREMKEGTPDEEEVERTKREREVKKETPEEEEMETPMPHKDRKELALEKGSFAQATSPWSGSSSAGIAKQADINAKLSPTPHKDREDLALEKGSVAQEAPQTASPWGVASFAAIAKQAHTNAELKKVTPEDVKKAAMTARRLLLQPKVSPVKKTTVEGLKRPTVHARRPNDNNSPPLSCTVPRDLPHMPSPSLPKDRNLEAELIAQTLVAKSVARLDADKAKAREDEDALLSDAMDFFSRFRKRGEETLKCSMCVAKVASMLRKGAMVLSIDFRLILKKKYKKFALKVGKDTNRSYAWLKPTFVKFLIDQGMKETDARNIKLSFKNCPSSIQTVPEFMQNKNEIARDVQLLHGQRTVYAAAALGRAGFRAHIEAIFSKHDEGITFGGIFTMEDLLILDEERVVILADPMVPAKTVANPFGDALPEDKCKDMTKMWDVLSPFYTRKGADGRDQLPLHFEDLRRELLGVQPSEVTTEAFRELIRCCFGLASCMARAMFSKGAYLITKQFGIRADPAVEAVFMAPLDDHLEDWKQDSKGSEVSAIRGVANFNDNLSNLPDNAFGCLGVDRHLLEHGGDHCDLDDLDELELLASDKYEELLHPILKALIYHSNPRGKYASLLSAYKAAAKNDKQDLPRGS